MTNYYPEFFNDVFGPIMQPGSSSHTAGPCRLGLLAHQLLKGPLKDIVIELDREGSFAGTFGHMNEDLGMLAGAYGLWPEDEKLFDIKNILSRTGINYEFRYVDFPKGSHPNAVRFLLTDEEDHTVTLLGNSTGGGMVETVRIMEIPFRFIGDCYLCCISVEEKNAEERNAESVLQKMEGILEVEAVQGADGKTLYFVRSEKQLEDTWTEDEMKILFRLSPILPVPTVSRKRKQLFSSFEEWTSLAEEEQISLPEAAVLYEQHASGWTKEQIMEYMNKIRRHMERQTQAVYEDDSALLETPYSGYHFAAWRDYEAGKKPLAGTVTARAIRYAFGVQALIKGVPLVPGPMGTGGGFLYAAMRAVKEEYGFSDEAVIDGLLVAAGVGAIAYTRTNPTGEMIGCAGECGMCGAMAAAGITQMAGGTPAQVEAAASLTLQMALGWPCDPIPGGNNQPCVSRFIAAVVMSISFSDLALSGRDAVLPFHEVVDEADKLGRQMPDSLKCTSKGGLCETPMGLRCRKNFEEWRNHSQREIKE